LFVKVPENQQATALEEGVATRSTLPAKPFTLSTSMTVCFSEPSGMAWDVGLSDMVKCELETVRLRVIECGRLPSLVVMLIV
jgi:hypothetical protein